MASKIDLQALYNRIARLEKKKHNASVGDVREVCRLLLKELKIEAKTGNRREVAKLVGLSKHLKKEC